MTQIIERPGSTLRNIEDVTRREFLIGGAGLLTLGIAGCGGGNDGVPSSRETRTVDGIYGPVELPVRPERVVSTWTTVTDFALVLDLPVVAAPGISNGAPFPAYQRKAYPDAVEELESIAGNPVNYEQVASAEPDCILSTQAAVDEEVYERLTQIAPTFAFSEAEPEGFYVVDWKGALRSVGRAFGREEAAERFVADYDERVEDLRGRLAERWSGATFAVVDPLPEFLYVFGLEDYVPHQVLFDELGLAPASFLKPEGQELSLEALPEVDADVLFVALLWEEGSLERDRQTAATYLDSPLWERIPAVRKGQVYEHDLELVYGSPLTANAFLDVIEENLLG